jgi:adenosylcobinamide-GDP ribazoletransferase
VTSSSLSLRVTGPLAPLVGMLFGALGGAVYWLAAQIWPSSVALILAMAATALASPEWRGAAATRFDLLALVLCLFAKFNTLMALSAAKLPFAAPMNFAPALIMICGYAASYALLVFAMATRDSIPASRIGYPALILAMVLGFAPATLLGIPGLIGLAAAVITCLSLMAFIKYKSIGSSGGVLDLTRLTTEAAFYMGALASWRFI